MSRDNAGWFKAWPDQPEDLAKCSKVAQCIAAGIHAVLDDCGGVPVDPSNPIGSLAQRMGFDKRERKLFHEKTKELLGSGYLMISADRIWVPSWAWQQRDKDGVVEDLFAKHENKMESQRPKGTQVASKEDAKGTQEGRIEDTRGTQGEPIGDTSGTQSICKSPKSLESCLPNKQPRKLNQTTKTEGLAPDVLKVLDEWRRCFNVREQVTYTPARVACAKAAIKRHSVEKCIDAIRGYATKEWFHEELGRHDVSVCLGSGGTTKDDKVLLGIEKLSEPGAQQVLAKVRLFDPGSDPVLRGEVMLAYLNACTTTLIDLEDFGNVVDWDVAPFCYELVWNPLNRVRNAKGDHKAEVERIRKQLLDGIAFYKTNPPNGNARPPEGLQEVPPRAEVSGTFLVETAAMGAN